jgi:DNA-directed RNA polymerase specialized sigma24 family protein
VRARFRDEADGSAAPWIARDVLLMSVRRRSLEQRARERLGLLAHAAHAAAQPDETWLDGLDEALDGPPAAQRDAMRLRIVDDLDDDHVARELGTSPRRRTRARPSRARHPAARFADSTEAPR